MKYTYFLTGYPGFLASKLITQLIHDHRKDIEQIYLLVLPSQHENASSRIKHLVDRFKSNVKTNVI